MTGNLAGVLVQVGQHGGAGGLCGVLAARTIGGAFGFAWLHHRRPPCHARVVPAFYALVTTVCRIAGDGKQEFRSCEGRV